MLSAPTFTCLRFRKTLILLPNQSTLAASHLHPEIENGTGDQQEEHSPYKSPCKDLGLIEVTPGEKDGDNDSRNSDHLALQCDP